MTPPSRSSARSNPAACPSTRSGSSARTTSAGRLQRRKTRSSPGISSATSALLAPTTSPTAALAQRLTNRLAHSASQVVFSFASHSEDGARRPSPLLRELYLAKLEPLSEVFRKPIHLDRFMDSEPLPALPEGLTRGGARILELQAACAFRAFAEIRLHSTQPDSRTPGARRPRPRHPRPPHHAGFLDAAPVAGRVARPACARSRSRLEPVHRRSHRQRRRQSANPPGRTPTWTYSAAACAPCSSPGLRSSLHGLSSSSASRRRRSRPTSVRC